MAICSLNDICEFITDGTHQTPIYCEEGGYPFLSSKDVTSRRIDWENVKRIPENLHEKLYKRLAPKKNDILLAKNGTTGVAAIVDRDDIFDVYVSLAVLRPKKGIYPQYLLYAINSPVAKRQFDAGLKGIGVPNLHLGVIRDTKINVCEYDKQIEICNLLDNVRHIIDARKQELQKLDELIKARFVEMFGNPLKNTKNWKTDKLQNLAPSKVFKGEIEDTNGKYWLLNLDMIESNTGIIIDKVMVDEDEIGSSTYVFSPENVLYSKLRPYLNKVVEPNDYGYATTELVPLYPKKDVINKTFLANLLRGDEFVSFINSKTAGAKMPRVSMGVFWDIELIVPPIELQNQFADFVQQVDKSKVVVQEALEKAQLLFDSLMQEYFG